MWVSEHKIPTYLNNFGYQRSKHIHLDKYTGSCLRCCYTGMHNQQTLTCIRRYLKKRWVFLVFHQATRPKSLPTLSLYLHNVIPLKDIPLTWTWVVIFTESKAHFACAAVTSRMIDTTLMTGVMSSNAFIMILENRKRKKIQKALP